MDEISYYIDKIYNPDILSILWQSNKLKISYTDDSKKHVPRYWDGDFNT